MSLKSSKLLVAAGLVGVCLLVYGGNELWQRHIYTHKPLPKYSETPLTTSSRHPDETPVKHEDEYTVPADVPRSISMPSIKEFGFIQKVGLDKSNAIAVPSNVHIAGWYVKSVKPGEKGVSLIDGHVQGFYRPGIFKNALKLKSGDTFTIEYGDHTTRKFAVDSIQSYSPDEASKQMLVQGAGIERQLNLITCGGKYDRAKHEYENRLIIRSKRIDII